MARMRAVKTSSLALWVAIGFAEAACCTVIMSENCIDRVGSDVRGSAFPGTVGDSSDHSCSGGVPHPLVKPKNVAEKLLLS